MNYPKITIVTPSYNQAEFLERTILSIINQDYPNMEYFVCDGGSTDGSVDIIKKYENNITWWCSEKDKGQTDAINKGMKKATGDIVGWINSDDVLLPGALKQIGAYYIKNPSTDFLNGLTIQIDKNDNIIRFIHIIMNKFFFEHGCYNISQQGMFWKRDLFQKIGFLDDSFHATMDMEWLIRNYENHSKIRLLNNYIGAIRIHENTKTYLNGSIWDDDYKKINERYNGRYSPSYGFMLIPYIFYKMLKGCYLKNWVMGLKYNGKYFGLLNHCDKI